MPDQEPTRPLLRVVRGNPDDAELAAVTTVLAAAASGGPADEQGSPERQRSRWADPAARLRPPPRPGPGAWRASALPN